MLSKLRIHGKLKCRLGHNQTAQHIETIPIRMYGLRRFAGSLDQQKSVLVDANDFALASHSVCIDNGHLSVTAIAIMAYSEKSVELYNLIVYIYLCNHSRSYSSYSACKPPGRCTAVYNRSSSVKVSASNCS